MNLITTKTNALSISVQDSDFPLAVETIVKTPMGKEKKIYFLSKTDTGALKLEVDKKVLDINKKIS